MFDDLLATVGGVTGMIALITFTLKVWPGLTSILSTWFYGHIDPDRLPSNSPIAKHWALTVEVSRQLTELAETSAANNRELRKDTIKNTLISLMADPSQDHSEAIRYELSKLEALDADCWVVSAAKKYLIDHLENITD